MFKKINYFLEPSVLINIIPKIIIPITPTILLKSKGTPKIKKFTIVDQTNCEYWKFVTNDKLESCIA